MQPFQLMSPNDCGLEDPEIKEEIFIIARGPRSAAVTWANTRSSSFASTANRHPRGQSCRLDPDYFEPNVSSASLFRCAAVPRVCRVISRNYLHRRFSADL